MTVLAAHSEAVRLTSPGTQRRRISVLGATGSIGENTLDLVGRDPSSYTVVALTGGRNAARLAELAVQHRAELAVIADESCYADLRARLAGTGIEAAAGADALVDAASRPADWVMAAIVAAGRIFMREVALYETSLLPVDSEHSAAMQVMGGSAPESIERICLTASGGPFRSWSLTDMAGVTPKQALAHPNWSMGPKVTIDSATLMNKALELIEAHHLFSVGADRLNVLIHPQSIVHCLVYYRDGSVLAQMSCPDMRTPIAYSLAWPNRMQAPTARLDLASISTLTFEAPDETRFPALRLARDVLAAGGSASTVLNAANEIAVEAFLDGRIGFLAIGRLVESTLDRSANLVGLSPDRVDDVLTIDAEARAIALSLLRTFAQPAEAR
jgi:1-deoxy-D-xylulose-5-phosphate reductoisomerase